MSAHRYTALYAVIVGTVVNPAPAPRSVITIRMIAGLLCALALTLGVYVYAG